MVIIILVLISIALLAISIELYKWRINKKISNFKSVTDWPVIGMGLQMLGAGNEKVMEVINQWSDEAGSPYRAWLGPYLIIGMDDPDSIQTVLSSSECLSKSYHYQFLRNKTGLFSSNVERWKVDRKALNPTFNPKIMNNFMPAFNEKIQIFIDQMETAPLDIYRPFYKLYADAIIFTEMDTKRNMQSEFGDQA